MNKPYCFCKKTQNQKTEYGFTLLELLIALTLMAFVSFFTAQTMKSTMNSSKKIQKDIDVLSELKSAVNLFKADVSRAYNSRDLYIAIYNEAQREHIRRWQEAKNKPTTTQPNQPADPNDPTNPNPNPQPTQPQTPQDQLNAQAQTTPPEYKPRVERVLTYFIGEKNRINFASINGNSIRKGSNTSELVEVGYELKKCKRRGRDQKDTECLWRRLSYYLDGEILEGGQESVLIEDVTEFELKYLRKKDTEEIEWRDNWPKDGPETENQLPLAVELKIQVSKPLDKEGENVKKVRTVAYIPIDFVNNENVQNIIKMNSQGNPLNPQDPNQLNQFQPTDQNGGFNNGNDFGGEGF